MLDIVQLFVSKNNILDRKGVVTGFDQEFAVVLAVFSDFCFVKLKPAVDEFFDIFPVNRMRLQVTDLLGVRPDTAVVDGIELFFNRIDDLLTDNALTLLFFDVFVDFFLLVFLDFIGFVVGFDVEAGSNSSRYFPV